MLNLATYIWLVLLSVILILSFIFNQLQRKYQISAVILLLLTGVLLQFIVHSSNIKIELPDEALKIFGTLGLLIIVLEAVMDIKLTRNNLHLFNKSLLFGSIIVIVSLGLIALLLKLIYDLSIIQALIYATPLSIVSSAIVIPSVSNLSGQFRDFLIMESVFSDIIGVLIFNFLATVEFGNFASISVFFLEFILMIIISLVTTFLLSILMSREKTKNMQVVILAVLILIYTMSKIFHLSALLLILVFGLSLRNLPDIIIKKYQNNRFIKHLNKEQINLNLKNMHDFIDEFGFIIRSIFFILLGYSINLSALLNIKVVIIGISLAFLIYLVRFISLYYFTANKYEQLISITMAPRGLITVLLFFQIPANFINLTIDSSIMFIVILLSGFVMSSGLITARKYQTNEVK